MHQQPATRREHDLLGDREVPTDAYYGVHTLRAQENFAITGISIAVYALIACVMLDRAGLVDWLPADLSGIMAWVVAAYFGLGIVMNLASRSVPERLVMSPTAALLCGLSVVVALG